MPLVSFLVIMTVFAAALGFALVLGLWMQLPLVALGVAVLGGSLVCGLRAFA